MGISLDQAILGISWVSKTKAGCMGISLDQAILGISWVSKTKAGCMGISLGEAILGIMGEQDKGRLYGHQQCLSQELKKVRHMSHQAEKGGRDTSNMERTKT